MPRTPRMNRPRVFLSFAGKDRETAKQLREDLADRGIDAFVDEQNITRGDNFVLAINDALGQSDYYVLLWSSASVGRPWVSVEWSAALVRDLQEQVQRRRSFLFIVRLDETPLPLLLAPRYFIDASGNWDGMVSELAATWSRDRAVGERVLPAPNTAMYGSDVHRPTIRLYVRNRALSVAHIIDAPADSTGQNLDTLVRSALALPDVETKFNGTVGMRFDYQLKNGENPIPVDGTSISDLCIVDDTTIDLEVRVESFGPEGSSTPVTYRGVESQLVVEVAGVTLSSAVSRTLIRSAFGHLTPW
jgi:TIR domain